MKNKGGGFPGACGNIQTKPGSCLVDLMTDQMVDMVYYKDKDFRYIFSSKPHCERILKCSQEECRGKTDVEIAALAGSRGHAQGFGQICMGSDVETRNNGHLSKFIEKATIDGEGIVLEIYKTPLFDENGAFNGIVGCSRDITDRVRIEDALKESEAQYRTIFELSPETIVTLDNDGVVLDVNHRTADILGIEPEDFIGKHLSEVPGLPEESKNIVQERFVQRMGGQDIQPYEVNFVSKTGEIRVGSISSNIIRDTDGDILGSVVIISDVTERKRAAEDLKRAHDDLESRVRERTRELFSTNERLLQEIARHKRTEEALKTAREFESSILGAIPHTVIGLKDRTIRFANHAAEAVFGWKPEELIGESTEILYRDKGEYTEIGKRLYDALEKQNTYSEEFPCRHRSGKDILCKMSAARLGGSLEEKRIVVIYEDITYHKKIEEELLKIRNLESMGILARGVAHDFNNLLTVIMGNIALAKMSKTIDKRVNDKLTESEKACLKAKDLTQLLLMFSKGGEAHKTVVDVDGLVRDSVHLALRGSLVRCEFETEEGLFPVEADDGHLRKVVRNITTNAREAMGGEGSLTVRVRNVVADGDDSHPVPEGRYVEISFEDTGVGIREEDLPKIFDPYFTTKGMDAQKGLGLGLAICHSIVKKHGGRITVDSQVGVGTTFHVYVPASREETTTAGKPSEPANTSGLRILVMDDEETIRDLIKIMLEHAGYEVATARGGQETIALYKDAYVSGRPFGAVILDLTIREGIGGKETLKELRGIDPHVPVIVTSGHTDDPVMKASEQHGFDGAITKPYKLEELQAVLLRVTGKRPLS